GHGAALALFLFLPLAAPLHPVVEQRDQRRRQEHDGQAHRPVIERAVVVADDDLRLALVAARETAGAALGRALVARRPELVGQLDPAQLGPAGRRDPDDADGHRAPFENGHMAVWSHGPPRAKVVETSRTAT